MKLKIAEELNPWLLMDLITREKQAFHCLPKKSPLYYIMKNTKKNNNKEHADNKVVTEMKEFSHPSSKYMQHHFY